MSRPSQPQAVDIANPNLQQQLKQSNGRQNQTRRDTTARPAPPTSQTTELTANQMKEELGKQAYIPLRRYGTRDDYTFQDLAVTGTSPEVGYKASLNEDELEKAYGPKG